MQCQRVDLVQIRCGCVSESASAGFMWKQNSVVSVPPPLQFSCYCKYLGCVQEGQAPQRKEMVLAQEKLKFLCVCVQPCADLKPQCNLTFSISIQYTQRSIKNQLIEFPFNGYQHQIFLLFNVNSHAVTLGCFSTNSLAFT